MTTASGLAHYHRGGDHDGRQADMVLDSSGEIYIQILIGSRKSVQQVGSAGTG